MTECECGAPRDGIVGCKQCDWLDGEQRHPQSKLGEVISALRRIDNMTVYELAKEIGLSLRLTQRWMYRLLEEGRVSKVPETGIGIWNDNAPALWRLRHG